MADTPTLNPNINIEGAGSGLKLQGPMRILVIRPDRLGDVILSTPVFEIIKKHYSKAHLTVLVKDHVLSVLKGLPSIDHFMVFDPEGRHAGVKGFFRLYAEIRRRHFRIAVVLQSHWKIAAVLFLARIRYRVGPYSKFHSFLFYNRGVRQRRSHVEMHEADYNLQLLRRLGIRVGTRNVPVRVNISEETQKAALEWLKNRGWTPTTSTIVVHPGMGGSALNWPESHYIELIRSLIQEGRQVVVTGGPTEGELLDRIERALAVLPEGQKEKLLFYRAKPSIQVDFIGAIYQHAHMVVAPSTGPLHLAVALGKPVLTFYPPIRVQSALRWGPYLQDESRASVLVPEVFCGQDFECLGHFCNYFPCMKSLTVKQAIGEVHQQLANALNKDQKEKREEAEKSHGDHH